MNESNQNDSITKAIDSIFSDYTPTENPQQLSEVRRLTSLLRGQNRDIDRYANEIDRLASIFFSMRKHASYGGPDKVASDIRGKTARIRMAAT